MVWFNSYLANLYFLSGTMHIFRFGWVLFYAHWIHSTWCPIQYNGAMLLKTHICRTQPFNEYVCGLLPQLKFLSFLSTGESFSVKHDRTRLSSETLKVCFLTLFSLLYILLRSLMCEWIREICFVSSVNTINICVW